MTDVVDASARPQSTDARETRVTDRDDATTDEVARRAAKDARRAEKDARRAEKDARRAAKVASRAEKDASRAVRKEAKRAAKAERVAARDAERAVRKEAKRAAKAERKAARAERKTARAERKTARADRPAATADRAAEPGATVGEATAIGRAAEPVPVMVVTPSHRKTGKLRRTPGARDAAHAASAAARGASRVLEEVAGLVRQAAEPAAAAIVRRAAGDERRAGTIDAAPHRSAALSPAEPPAPPSAPADPGARIPAVAPMPPSTAVPAPSIAVVPAPPVRVEAAIDIGSNSVHLLVAVVAGHRLEPLVDESVFLGLGDRVREHGTIGGESRRRHVEALRGYVATARQLGATDVAIVGTEPVRRAADAARLVAEVEEATGTGLQVLDHAEEGILTLIGVTGGRRVMHDLVVVDVGGGSSEFVVVGPDRAPEARGLRVGSASLTAAFVSHDPPTEDELRSLAREARRLVAGAPAARPRELVAVGGTASNLARLVPAAALERSLTSGRIATARSLLLAETAAEAAARHAVNPVRARLLPAGAAIVDAVLDHYGANRIRVSEAGVREGAVLAMTQAGPAWRDQLGRLAVGWRG